MTPTTAPSTHHRTRAALAALTLTVASFTFAPNARADEGSPPEVVDIHDFLLSAGKTALENAGTAILEDLGKQLAAIALDSFIPGLSSLFGLGGGDPFEAHVQRILDAIAADGDETRALLNDAWEWAREQSDAEIQSDFDAAMDGLDHWMNYELDEKIFSVSELSLLTHDFRAVRATLENRTTPADRVKWLHSYAIFMAITLELIQEHALVTVIGTNYTMTSQQGEPLATWASRISPEERARIDARIAELTTDNMDDLFFGGTHSEGLFAHTSSIARGTLLNGRGFTDYRAVSNDRFTDFRALANAATPTWVYEWNTQTVVNPDLCTDERSEINDVACHRFRVHLSGPSFFATFDRRFYSDVPLAFVTHQDVEYVRSDVLIEGYGSVRVLLDQWWSRSRAPGFREYTPADADLDRAILGSSKLGSFELSRLFSATLNGGARTLDEQSLLIGYLLQHGRNTVGMLADSALANPDPLAGTPLFPMSTHLVAVSSQATTRAQMDSIYRGQFAAKVVAIVF